MAPVDWKVVAEKLSQLDIWLAAIERERLSLGISHQRWIIVPCQPYSPIMIFFSLIKENPIFYVDDPIKKGGKCL